MPSRPEVVDLVQRYAAAVAAQDVDAATALFAADARHEDPVGEGVDHGRPAIRTFFEQWFSFTFDARLDGAVTVHGRFVAFRLAIEVPAGRTPFRVLVTTFVEVTPDLLVASLTAVPDAHA
ncbi:nuclear transport factor 2 family protein [Nocardioides mangrovicus]|uniref:nuclear transport factor 2 family protein n=1 Tax=Nocardioides mangrovicus TaxID=2478913 RepID=UPI001313FBCF|nr:nuclear transport factor 2 family protein [Nocardioides mangrovicus]